MKKYYVDNIEVNVYKFMNELNTGNYISEQGLENEQRIVYSPALKKAQLRVKREPLLIAFDKWEKAVLRGREEDSAEIMQWYQDLLDLVESAFENVPDRINYYM